MSISSRKAVEITVRTLLDAMVEDRGLNIPQDRLDSLAVDLADTDDFLTHLEDALESYLEDFGENHDLYDLWD